MSTWLNGNSVCNIQCIIPCQSFELHKHPTGMFDNTVNIMHLKNVNM